MLNNMQIVFGVYEARNGHGFWFHKVELMLGERTTHGQPTAQIGTVKNSPGLLVGQKMCDTPIPGVPLTTRQPSEYPWMSSNPTPHHTIVSPFSGPMI